VLPDFSASTTSSCTAFRAARQSARERNFIGRSGRNTITPETLSEKHNEEATMTYPNDPNLNRDPNLDRTNRMGGEGGYTGWIIGVIVLVAIIIAIVATTNRGNNANTASNANAPASTNSPMSGPRPSAPSTTGFGTNAPAPKPSNPAPSTPSQPAH
jgi:hypothetical protein